MSRVSTVLSFRPFDSECIGARVPDARELVAVDDYTIPWGVNVVGGLNFIIVSSFSTERLASAVSALSERWEASGSLVAVPQERRMQFFQPMRPREI
jgi:hypothetical protein